MCKRIHDCKTFTHKYAAIDYGALNEILKCEN